MSHLFEFFLWERVDVHDILRGLGHEAFVAPGRSNWISLQIITWGLSTYANGDCSLCVVGGSIVTPHK